MSAEASSTQASLVASPVASWLELLVSRGAMVVADAAQLNTVHRESHQSLASVALRLGKISERTLADAMAEARGLELISAANLPEQLAVPANVLPAFWRNHELLLLAVDERTLTVATWDATDRKPIEALLFATRLKIVEKIATRSAVIAALEANYAPEAQSPAANSTEFSSAADDDEIDRLKDLASDAPISRLVHERLGGIRLRRERQSNESA